ncbi:hypothetical protein UJ101_02326 [Flavobacteriaceae bacterium UJ101]|nr:hypothetical protein UJ101_02326 [Flavobacteriaceae bacterium UJ101]
MAKKKYNKKAIEESTTKEVFESLDQSAIESEQFLEKNAKPISIVFGVLLAIVLAYFAYVKLYQEPQNQVATKDLYNAKVELDKDSLNLALDGQSGGYIGLNEIKEKYSGTNAGNLANYYAAVANYKQGDYSKAFDNLNAFDANDEILAAMKIGMQGDCLVQTAEYEKALEYYQNAANARDNEFTTPMYLLKAGKLALTLNKKDQALKFFTQIKEQYGESNYATDIDKYIARAK